MIETLLAADLSLFAFVNQFAGRSEVIDSAMRLISANEVVKGIPIMMMFWALWFADELVGPETRQRLIALLVTSIVAIATGRAIAALLPLRLRPMQDPELVVKTPLDSTAWDGWTSMPSDHAVMFFSIAVAFFFVNRWAGLVAFLHAAVVISAPRVFLGLHFPSDVLIGALVGSAIAVLLMPLLTSALVDRRIVERAQVYPYLLYPVMFFVTFQSASMFESLRRLLGAAAKAVTLVL